MEFWILYMVDPNLDPINVSLTTRMDKNKTRSETQAYNYNNNIYLFYNIYI